MAEFVLWGSKYGVPPIKITGGTREECRSEMGFRVIEGGWDGLLIIPKGTPYHSRPEWQLPYQPRMMNDRDPGDVGPVCPVCAPDYVDLLTRAEQCPMSSSPYGGQPYRSPHYGTYLHEARVIQWACATGNHGIKLTTY